MNFNPDDLCLQKCAALRQDQISIDFCRGCGGDLHNEGFSASLITIIQV
jgi:hypothetical protein